MKTVTLDVRPTSDSMADFAQTWKKSKTHFKIFFNFNFITARVSAHF